MTIKTFAEFLNDTPDPCDIDPYGQYQEYVSKETLKSCVGKTISAVEGDDLIRFTDGSWIYLTGASDEGPDRRMPVIIEPLGMRPIANLDLQEGDLVLSISESPYSCIVGQVKKIHPVGSDSHNPEHEEADAEVDFTIKYSDEELAKIRFIVGGGKIVRWEDVHLDKVVIPVGKLIRITDVEPHIVDRLHVFPDYAATFAYVFTTEREGTSNQPDNE